MTRDTHDTIEMRLPTELTDIIHQVARDADVTPDQAASVVLVLALHRTINQRDKQEERRELDLSSFAQGLKDEYIHVVSGGDQHRVQLVVGNQHFDLSVLWDTHEEADFIAIQLAKALETLIEAETEEEEPDRFIGDTAPAQGPETRNDPIDQAALLEQAPGEYNNWEKRVWRRGYNDAIARNTP